jgi:hypothetical protein
MSKTREIFELSDAPDGAPACEDCGLVLDLAEQLWPGISDVDLAEKLRRMLADPELRRPPKRPAPKKLVLNRTPCTRRA